jgi:hypothetical protein
MRMREATTQWTLFTSTQVIVILRAGFERDARINMLPGVPVMVHDAYIGGEGLLRVTEGFRDD